MPEIKDRFHFRPNKDALKAWLSTRKRPMYIRGETYPGLMQTAGYGTDVAWFIFAMCIETAAVILTLYGGWTKGGNFLAGAVLVVLLFVVFDVVGANFVHRPVGNRIYYKNQMRLAKDSQSKQFYAGKIKKGRGLQALGITLILLSGALKILAILLLGSFPIMFYVIMGILYLLVIYVHINHTGYFFAERKARRMFEKQHDLWVNGDSSFATGGDHGEEEDSYPFYSEVALNLHDGIISTGGGKISITEYKGSTQNKENYQLKMKKGVVLLDSDIEALTNGQNDAQARQIVLACIGRQLQFIPAPDGGKPSEQ